MLSTSAEHIASDLLQYGEDATAAWVLRCTDAELVRVCSVGCWLLFHGPGPSSGGSMLVAKAVSLAAVYVHEGAPRELARTRRRGQPTWTTHQDEDGVWHLGRLPDAVLAARVTADHGVGVDARAVWQAR
ncbi:hypothetical protein SAMN05660199_02319 [Klenkia soli]|uniref:Uncharacterized protein n=1 Tax=Klenkia soli TaxID=1052260 RepID=A0A1H0L3F4_9ACTN|nr:hypothetical protein [Klenkia soli]SDO62510.1 hypothetical protein SAMN05660199_02319 [Klenkia soli]